MQGHFGEAERIGQTIGAEGAPLTPSTTASLSAPSHHNPTRPAPIVDGHSPRNHAGSDKNRTAPEKELSICPGFSRSPVPTFTRSSRVETRELAFSGNFYFHCEHRLASPAQAVTRSVTHKTRLFGPSHWINAVGLASLPSRPQ